MKKPCFRAAALTLAAALLLLYACCGCGVDWWPAPGSVLTPAPTASVSEPVDLLSSVPDYFGEPYFVLNNNQPLFSEDDLTRGAFEEYGELDALGRCGVVFANVGVELLPTGDRENIREIRPSGWQSVRYAFIDGESLYNRCHLIGFQLTGEGANARNLITGTRYLNVNGMLPFENRVVAYVRSTGNHVLYRVTPHFAGDELVARGVRIEALSVEDGGKGIRFHVYIYNVQPGVIIDYSTGESRVDEDAFAGGEVREYVLNTNSHKFHLPSCDGAASIKPGNRQEFTGTRGELLMQGYKACGSCNP